MLLVSWNNAKIHDGYSISNPNGVRELLETYPDIPVYMNEELALYFEGNPNVYVSKISRDEVL